jgi:hypothetical protein
MGRGGGIRYRIRIALGISPLALAGCNGAPSQTIFGSYFPSWMLCALAGIAGAIVVRAGLGAAGIDKVLPAPLIVYLAFAVFFAYALWLAWLS